MAGPWDDYDELPTRARAVGADAWTDFEELTEEQPIDSSDLGPVVDRSATAPPPWMRPLAFEQEQPTPGSGVIAPPLHTFTDADLGAVFGPREAPPRVSAPMSPEQEADIASKIAGLGEPSTGPTDFSNALFTERRLGPRLSEPGPRNPLPEIEVAATREARPVDTRPLATFGDTLSAIPGTVGGRYELKAIGAQELVASHDARKKFLQAMWLPEAIRHVEEQNRNTPDERDRINYDEDPIVIEMARRAGVRPDIFARDWPSILAMERDGTLEAFKQENQALIPVQETRLAELAKERQDVAAELQRIRPHFESEWSGKALLFDTANSVIADMAPAFAVGALAGPEAGLTTMGGLVLPEEYANIKNDGGSDAQALFGSLARTAAEIAPEAGVLEVALKTATGKEVLRQVLGKWAGGKTGHIAGVTAAEAASEDVTEAINIGLDMGLFGKDVSLVDALDRLARAGVIGGLMGGAAGAVTTPLPEPHLAPNAFNEDAGPLDVRAFDAALQGAPDALPTAGTADFADVFAGAQQQGFAAPTVPQQSDVQQTLPMFGKTEPRVSTFDIFNEPALTGSRDPGAAGGGITAPSPPVAQGTAQPPPLSSAIPQPVPAASPAPPATNEPAPAPAPAAPAVSPTQEPPAGEAAPSLIHEEQPEVARELSMMLDDPDVPVLTYEPDPRGGLTTSDKHPEWEAAGSGGWQTREYITKIDGELYPVQELKAPNGRLYTRGYDLEGKPFNNVPPSAAREFQNRVPPRPYPKKAAQPGAEPKKTTAGRVQWKPLEPRVTTPPMPKVETGKPLTTTVYRGEGKSAAEIYSGAQVPVAGEGGYYAFTPDDARQYGDKVSQGEVTLANPLVIRTDEEWRDLTKGKAGWEFPNPYGQPAAKVSEWAKRLRDYVMSQGHDSLVIDPSEDGDAAKTLWNVFDHAQVVDYGTTPAATEQPGQTAAPAAKPLQLGEVYPIPDGPVRDPVRENVGESEPGNVTEMPTTPDKFEEVINEFSALFEAPKKRVSLPLERHWKKQGKSFLSPEEAARRIESWQKHAEKQSEIAYPNGNSEKVILSLFDLTGHWAQPYADAGYDVRTLDIQNGADVLDLSVEWFAENMPDIVNVYGILIACPCTDFTVSGSQWWADKDADGRTELSKELVFQALRTVEFWRPAMWVLENPVGRIEELTGLPPARMAFDPWHFGDPYTKRTLLWGKFNADLPTAPVEPLEGSKMQKKFGGKSQRTKNARSATPKGFASAFFMANNYLDATPAERLLSQFPEAAGAIEQALAAGFTEKQIRDVVTEPYENYEYDEARDALRQLVKGAKKAKPAKAEKPAPAPAAEPTPAREPAPSIKTGKRETVATAAGTRVETEFEVIDAADIITSDNPAYPKTLLQPRDRERIASAEQVAKMGGSINPAFLGSNPHAETGAPIIGKDDNFVESGNGRVMALRHMYARDSAGAQKYRDMVAEVSGQDVSSIKEPILVRRRVTDMTDAQREKFTKEANKTAVARMSASEQAKMDQDALTPAVMAKLPEDIGESFDLEKGEGTAFVEAFVAQFPPAERGDLIDADGKPSATAVTRATAALLTRAFGGTPAGKAAIRRATESKSKDAQTLVKTLFRFAPAFAKLKDDIAAGRVQDQADIGDKIAEAVEVIRSAGKPGDITNWMKTEGLLDQKDETVRQLVQTFYVFDGYGNAKRISHAAAIADTLSEYLKLARQFAPEQAGGGLFGDEGAAPTLNPAAELGKLNAARQSKVQARERQEAEQGRAQGGLFTAGGKPSAAVSSGPRDADGGQEERQGGPRARRYASGLEAQEESDQADFLADELRRPKRRKSKRRPGPYSMSREGEIRAAENEQIWTDAGLDPDLMELAPPPVRFKRAAELLQKRFGFRAITKAKNLNWGEAIDAIKDAYVGLSNLAAVQNFNPAVLSLNGRLALSLEREHEGALAYYNPGTKTIGMTRRNDAFAHEWGHALDHFMVETFAPEMLEVKGRHLTGKTRAGGVAETMHDQVRDAYIAVLNAMYFDGAKAALYVADLEKKIATARTDKQRLKWQTQLDNFRMGHSKKGGIESEYYEAAKAMDSRGPEGAGDDGYWQRPTEMFARSYEAYIGDKLAGLPAQHPFVTQSQRMYNENRIGRMSVPYPQQTDRTNIFFALDTMMRALRDASMVDSSNVPAAIAPTDTRYWKKLAPQLPPAAATQARGVLAKIAAPFKQQLAELHRADREIRERDKQDQGIRNVKLNEAGLAGRRRWLANQGLKAIEWINALPAMLAHTVRGVILSLEARHAGNQGIAWLRAKFATDPGSGRYTGGVWSEEVRHRDKELQNRFAEIVKKHKVRGFNDTELRQLRDVLVDAIPASAVDPKIAGAAADMRRFLNDMYSYNVSNGVEIGYAKNGYLPRIMDSLLVENDVDGFRTQARALYARVYSKEIGTLDSVLRDPLENPKGLKNIIQYVKEIAKGGNVADARVIARDLLDDAKELEKALKELQEANENGEDTEEIEERIAELGEKVYYGLRDAWAMEAANDWEMRIRGIGAQPEFAFEKRGPDGKYSKSRVLPEETDALMGDYMKNDPLELITTYISQSVRRVEFGKFFGNETKDQKLGWKLDAALDSANRPYRAADGSMQRISADEFEELQKSIDLLTGRYNTNMTKKGLRWRMKLTAVMTPVILARSLKAQLAEPIVVYRKTGNVSDAMRVYYSQMQDLAAKLGIKGAKKQAAWRREMSEYFGIVADHMADQLMLQRYNLMDLNSSDRVKMARFFHIIGVHPHAMSMRRGVADIFMTRYAPQMAARALKGGKQGALAVQALAELGLDVQSEGLLAELAQLGNIKDVAQLNKMQHIDQIRTAINRFTDQAIQNPSAIDKPRLASMPEYSFMFGILSFQFAYQRNVLIATGKEINRAWKQDWKLGVMAGASAAASYSLLGAGQLAAWVLGMALWSDDDWDDIEEKMTQSQFGMPAWIWQSMSRSGFFGAADPIVNAFLGLKYERDLSQIMAGAIPAAALKVAQDVGRAVLSDSETNTMSHRAIESVWNGGVGPLVTSTVLKIAGANPYLDAVLGMGLPYLTSPLVSEWVADTAVGDTNRELLEGASEGDIEATDELQQRELDKDINDIGGDLENDLLDEAQ